MSAKRVFVTGGAGFIGSVICKAMAGAGHDVVAFDNLSFGKRELLGPARTNLRLVEGDIRDADHVAKEMSAFAPQQVLHLAAIHFIPYCNAHPVEAVEVNINGARNVLAACRHVSPEVVLFASTAAVYPIDGSPFVESGPPGPLDIYGHTKLAGEDLCRLYYLDTQVPTVVARFFNAFGPNDTNPHLIPDIVGQLMSGSRTLELGNLDPVRDYIHVEDMTTGVCALLDRFKSGFDVFNVGSGMGYSVRDVIAAFSAALGEDIAVTQVASRIRKVERAQLVADIARLRSNSGWSPRWSLAQGISELVSASNRQS
jgi:UDP-glucose 4-epimerase